MRQFQISEHFKVKDGAELSVIKQQLDERIGDLFKIQDLKESNDGRIEFKAYSGAKDALIRHTEMHVKCDMMLEDGVLRIMARGQVKAAFSQTLLYSIGLLFVLLIGLLPGSLNTSWENAGAGDAAIFLIIGGYIVYDIETKLHLAEQLLRDAVDTLRTEFSATGGCCDCVCSK